MVKDDRAQFKDPQIKKLALTKVPHALLVRVIQEEIALLDGTVDLEAETQACILHQVRQDVLS